MRCGFGPAYGTTRWTFEIDDYTSLSQPLIAGSYVYTSTTNFSPYALLALRLSDGAPAWCLPITQQPPGTPSSSPPYPAAAGNGLLLVANGSGRAACESGGAASACARRGPTPPGSSPPPAPQPAGPALTLTARRHDLQLGERTKVVARLSGLSGARGRRIVLELDKWPLDGRFVRAGRGTTGSGGAARFTYAPRRNGRLRARLVGAPGLISKPVTVYADFPLEVRKHDAGGSRPRLRVKLLAPARARVLRRPVFAYLAGRTGPWTRMDRERWRRGRRAATVTLRYPRGALERGDHWLVCTRERRPDAFGRPSPLDPLCGRPTLPR